MGEAYLWISQSVDWPIYTKERFFYKLVEKGVKSPNLGILSPGLQKNQKRGGEKGGVNLPKEKSVTCAWADNTSAMRGRHCRHVTQ